MADHYQIVVTDVAFSDIQQAVFFLARVSPEAAKRLGATVKNAISSLQGFPFRFEEIEMPGKTGFSFRKAVIEGRYLLIYAIKGTTVVVERLIDARQGLATLL
ncbi:MAG: type II toxin-antitoxin system RelE/ParE family toxin [Erysipelotrichaceae bacterium]|jgi:plasmid stabilization system protein ParE|nr:type II toxin-antitoxin system RelE/ParE family toxin [Erysipelotrichaceae bacterium]